jgi:hypothetical protein
MTAKERERPSAHGVLLGGFLADVAEAGRLADPTIPAGCATCAFSRETMTNRMAATGIEAMHCVIGTDPAPFGCHHGMKDGEPTKLCAGFVAAQAAPFDLIRSKMEEMVGRLAALPPVDEVRAEFDAWAAKIDPDGAMDDYCRGRLYVAARREGTYP